SIPPFSPGEGLSNYYSKLVSFSFAPLNIEQKKLVELRKKIAILSMQKLSIEKRKQYLENKMPADKTVSAWCADLTEDLSGEIGTVEIPGESTYIQIQPGYENNAAYDLDRDGQLLPAVVSTPAQTFYNLAMLPGWQKWKPLFRYGTITAIDGDTADITLENIKSSQQSLEINQTDTLTGVAIEYMSCNSGAFADDDEVLLKFPGQSWEAPIIVGFKDNPKPCTSKLLVSLGADYCFVWDFINNSYAAVPLDDESGDADFPILRSLISIWLSKHTNDGVPALAEESLDPILGTIPDLTIVNWYEDFGSFPDAYRIWYNTKDGTDTIVLDGYDESGNTPGSMFKLYSSYHWGYTWYGDGYENIFSYSYSSDILSLIANPPKISPHFQYESLTSVIETRGRAVSQSYVGGGNEVLNNKSLYSNNTMIYKSPFSDNASFSVVNSFSSNFVQDSIAVHIKTVPMESPYNADAIRSEDVMVCFYAEQVKMSTTSYPSCAIGTINLEGRFVDASGTFCTTGPVITYEDGKAFNVVAFSKIAESEESTNDFNPFTIPEDIDLGAAMMALHTFYEAQTGAPADDECSDVYFSTTFLL
ncbi:MAG: hypothetical protein QM498_05375, partial [Desulfobacterium sp.]